MSQCRSCGDEIIWAVHVGTERRAPIDAEPSEGGNIMFTMRPDAPGRRFEYRVFSKLESETYQGDDAHLSHFVTCPHAKEHR